MGLKRDFQSLIAKVLKSEFNRNTLILITGTVIAQLLPILFFPVITRIYTPAQIGVLSTFMTLAIILGNIVGGKYELAIVLPKKETEAKNIFALGLLLTAFFAVILQIILFFASGKIAGLLKSPQLKFWLLFLPLAFAAVSLFNFFNYLFTRYKKYKQISYAKVIRGSSTVLVQVLFGLIRYGGGLILGYVTGLVLGVVTFVRMLSGEKYVFRRVLSWKKIRQVARKYKKFPIYNVPGVLANRLSSDLPNLLVPPFYGQTTLGYFSGAYRFMTVPSYFVGLSLAQVYYEEASKEFRNTGSVHKTFFSVLKKLVIISVPVFLTIFVIAKPVFAILLGKSWYVSGIYAQIITPYIFIRFIVSPLSNTLFVLQKQEYVLGYQVLLLLSSAGSLFAGHLLGFDFQKTLIMFSFAMFLAYAVTLGIILYWVLYFKKHHKTA